MRRRHYLHRSLTCLLLALGTLAGASLQAAYVTQAEAGFDGYVQANCWIPVRFECENTGPEAFEGELSVTLHSGPRAFVFRRPVSLPSPSHKVVTLGVFLGHYPGQSLHWQLIGRGRVVEEGDVLLRPAAGEDLLLLAATSRTAGINLLNGKKLGSSGGEVRLIPYGPGASGRLPDTAYGYEAAGAVLWGDIPPASLRPAQIEALQNWVLSGGSLVVWGGAAGDQLQGSWLMSLLPVRLLGLATLTEEEAFTRNYFFPIDLGAGWVITAAQALPGADRGAQVLLQESDFALVVQAPYGLGTVTFLAFDPTSPQFAGWPGAGLFLDYLLTAARMERREFASGFRPLEYGGYTPSLPAARGVHLQELLQRDPLLKPPSFRFISLFLLAYVLIVGPVNYVMLRYKKKLELTWITIPIIVLVFLAAEYGLGRRLKGDRIVVNAVELLLGDSGRPVLEHQALFGLFSPAKEKYSIEFDEPGSRVMPVLRSLWREEAKETVFREQERIRIDEHPMNMWTMDLFWAQGRLPLGDAVVCELKLTPDGIGGFVENHSTLTLHQPCLFWMGKYLALPGSLSPGEKITLDLPLSVEDAKAGVIPAGFLKPPGPVEEERAKGLLEFLKENHLNQQSGQIHLLAWVGTAPPGSLLLGESSFDLRSERLLCVRAVFQREQPTVNIAFGQFTCRWFSPQGDYEQARPEDVYGPARPGEVRFSQGELIAELMPAAPFPPLRQVDLLRLNVQFSNPSSIPLTLEVRDWQQGEWTPLVRRTDQDLKRVFRLTEKEGIAALALLRPGDHAMQVRFRVLAPEGESAAATPTATPGPGAPGFYPGMMPPPARGGRGGATPGQITVHRVDLRLEGQVE